MRKVQNRKAPSFGLNTPVRSIQTEGFFVFVLFLFFFNYISINTLSLSVLGKINVELELESKPVNTNKKDSSIQNKWNNKDRSLLRIAERWKREDCRKHAVISNSDYINMRGMFLQDIRRWFSRQVYHPGVRSVSCSNFSNGFLVGNTSHCQR